ncbi:MAG: glycoside hydrolase family 92 protein, partial [Prolixibacteraceae bacterium]|nr:glycoside hydrolase family 92 protein [Prolixibacteraceae bacterium]
LETGYIPADKVTESVPKTLEFAYYDWGISQMAKETGKEEDYLLFMKRAGYYTNLWDRETEFMRPKNSDGSWFEEIHGRDQEIINEGSHSYYRFFDPLLVGRRPGRHYTESNAWQYLWAVQYDIPGLIKLMGGNKKWGGKMINFTLAAMIYRIGAFPRYLFFLTETEGTGK